MIKMKLRKWVKVVLLVLFLLLIVYVIISLFTRKEVVQEYGKNYTCHGSIILQVCYGETYD